MANGSPPPVRTIRCVCGPRKMARCCKPSRKVSNRCWTWPSPPTAASSPPPRKTWSLLGNGRAVTEVKRDTGFGTRDTKFGIRDSGLGTRNWGLEVRPQNLKSQIPNPRILNSLPILAFHAPCAYSLCPVRRVPCPDSRVPCTVSRVFRLVLKFYVTKHLRDWRKAGTLCPKSEW